MPFSAILSALVQLGANPSTLKGLGSVTERVQKNYINHETLLKALKRLLAIIKAAGWLVESILNRITLFMEYIPVLALSLQMMSQMWS